MSFKIEIRKPDNSLDATHHFNTSQDAQTWLDLVKSQSYWENSYTAIIIDITPPLPTQAEIDAENAKRLKFSTNLNKIKDLKGKNLSTPEMKVAVEAILEVLGL